jgi:branched-chain amino acid transport system ATP-binding protein
VLSAQGIRVRFGGVVAVDDVSLTVDDKEVVGLIGPNGSGKSTLINALTGLVPATGHLQVDGVKVGFGTPGQLSRLGVLRTFQTPQVHDDLTCLENVLHGIPDRRLRSLGSSWLRRRSMLRLERTHWETAHAALEFAHLENKWDQAAGALAYGERRRLELARAYVGRPRTLLLDEPAAGLNHVETSELVGLLKGWHQEPLGPALLIVEHKIDFIEELCQRMIVLELGRQVAEGTPAEVWSNPKVIDAYLGQVITDA